ncbi:hypothetical protein D9M70_494470 [compost metagenome]
MAMVACSTAIWANSPPPAWNMACGGWPNPERVKRPHYGAAAWQPTGYPHPDRGSNSRLTPALDRRVRCAHRSGLPTDLRAKPIHRWCAQHTLPRNSELDRRVRCAHRSGLPAELHTKPIHRWCAQRTLPGNSALDRRVRCAHQSGLPAELHTKPIHRWCAQHTLPIRPRRPIRTNRVVTGRAGNSELTQRNFPNFK